jgi:hypothetical protein
LPFPISSTFLGSAWPIAFTEVASHCWSGFATKKPSEVNQNVKGAEILVSVVGDDDDVCVRIVSS